MRHLETTTLWVQRYVTEKLLALHKILGTENDADLGTKHVDRQTMVGYLKRLGYAFMDGRHPAAKSVIT